MFSRKVNLLFLLYFILQRSCLLHLSDRQGCVLNFFLKISILMCISLFDFPPTINSNFHKIVVTPKMVKIVATALNFSKTSSSPKLSYILVNLFNESFGEFFSRSKVSFMVPQFKNIRERSLAKPFFCC